MVITTQKPTYNELFITKQNHPIGDLTLHQNALLGKHLLTIADAENTEEILKRLINDLTAEQIKNLNSRWTGFTHELKKNFEKGIEKDTLVRFVIEFLSEIKPDLMMQSVKKKPKKIRIKSKIYALQHKNKQCYKKLKAYNQCASSNGIERCN